MWRATEKWRQRDAETQGVPEIQRETQKQRHRVGRKETGEKRDSHGDKKHRKTERKSWGRGWGGAEVRNGKLEGERLGQETRAKRQRRQLEGEKERGGDRRRKRKRRIQRIRNGEKGMGKEEGKPLLQLSLET